MNGAALVLGLDAATPPSSVAVVRGPRTLAWRTGPFGRDTDAWILPAIQEELAEAGVDLGELDCLATSVGPGTFTGIRVTIATALGLAGGLGKPVGGVGTLEALLASAVHSGATGPVLALLDARRGQLYAAWTGSPQWGPEVLTPHQVRERIQDCPAPLGIGTGTAVDAALCERLRILEPTEPLAVSVALVTAERWARAGAAGLPEAQPAYLREPDAKVGVNPLRRRRSD